mmetsp:Transcript_3992/g.14842  ORF Transcript_3992/g.14842 Transcript_3992/m.14842 type:complete len:249 (-) Transcript_3992:513-1259(-)
MDVLQILHLSLQLINLLLLLRQLPRYFLHGQRILSSLVPSPSCDVAALMVHRLDVLERHVVKVLHVLGVGARLGPVELLLALLEAGRSTRDKHLLVSLEPSCWLLPHRVHDLHRPPEHLVPAGGVLLLVVVPDVHDVATRARPSVLLGERAVSREDLDRRHAFIGALGLTELDHEDRARARSSPQHLCARGQGILLDSRDRDSLLRKNLWCYSHAVRNVLEAPVRSRAVVAIRRLDGVEKVRVDELNR